MSWDIIYSTQYKFIRYIFNKLTEYFTAGKIQTYVPIKHIHIIDKMSKLTC